MSNKISKSLQLNLFLTLTIGILNFIVNKYFANYMGLNTLGLMKLFTQLIAYLSLVDLGISNASTYALYKPLVEKNNHKINVVISTIDSFYKKISIIIFIIGMGIILFIPYLIDIKLYGKEIYIYWILYVINTSLGYMFAKYSILFTANQEYHFVRKIQGTGKIIFQLLQIIFLIKIQSFALYIVIMMFENLYNYYFYRKHYRNNYKFIKKVKEKDNTIIEDMKNLFWHKIGTLIIHNTDYIVLTKYVSLGVVGIYSSYLIIYQMLLTIINIITPVLTPKIGIFVTENSKEKIYKYWKELNTVYYFIATIFILCAYKLILPFIKLWLGDEFILSSMTVSLILVNLFIHLIRGITDTFKNSCGFFNDIYVPALESILNLVFSLILVKKIGLNGVIIGTIISNITIILLLKPILVFKKCFDKNGYD
ncbi:MAG: lipopolysaccharide biosynthesis protein, partial [Cetobacterium sp.]|uniref:lipopolysaccharide biosynthesis protein n=1 Tax=Cetobacterium sp. TaxID=2071632 RepID=UPI003F3911A8